MCGGVLGWVGGWNRYNAWWCTPAFHNGLYKDDHISDHAEAWPATFHDHPLHLQDGLESLAVALRSTQVLHDLDSNTARLRSYDLIPGGFEHHLHGSCLGSNLLTDSHAVRPSLFVVKYFLLTVWKQDCDCWNTHAAQSTCKQTTYCKASCFWPMNACNLKSGLSSQLCPVVHVSQSTKLSRRYRSIGNTPSNSVNMEKTKIIAVFYTTVTAESPDVSVMANTCTTCIIETCEGSFHPRTIPRVISWNVFEGLHLFLCLHHNCICLNAYQVCYDADANIFLDLLCKPMIQAGCWNLLTAVTSSVYKMAAKGCLWASHSKSVMLFVAQPIRGLG